MLGEDRMDVADQAVRSYTDADAEGVNLMGRLATADDMAKRCFSWQISS
jgi:hypothetical protein